MRCSVFVASIAALIALAPTAASPKTFKWTSQGDITSLDPQAQSDSLNIAASLFVYDPLVRFDVHYKIIPWRRHPGSKSILKRLFSSCVLA